MPGLDIERINAAARMKKGPPGLEADPQSFSARPRWCCRVGYSSLRQRIGADLEMHRHGLVALAAFGLPGRAVAAAHPQTATLPAAIRVVDTPVHALGEEAHRVRQAEQDHLAILEGDHAILEVGGRDRHVAAETE